ncbi:MAG: tetratricopeptide repeat protein [Chitinophagaceae bacterium]|nr:tetratricopeptide repeat protein [Chitinophagaceae bacterium]
MIAKSGQSRNILRELEAKADNHQLRTRFFVLKAAVLYYQDVKPDDNVVKEHRASSPAKAEILALYVKAMNEAYLSGDERLIAKTSLAYGQVCLVLKELELAVTYTMNGVELNEKLGIENSPYDYMVVGEIFFKIREYDECVKNSLKAFQLWKPQKGLGDTIRMMFTSNTTALGYHRQQQYDSAFVWYRTSLTIATALKNDVWKGIISGNMGQIYYEQKKYDTALSLFKTDYTLSKEGKLFDNAANSIQWAARTQLRLGNTATALQYLREAFHLLEQTPEMFYLRNTYYAAVDVFKTMAVYDSAFYYNAKYASLNDSLERVIALSGVAVSKARANAEKSRYSIQALIKEKEKQLLQRNILITAIVLLGIVGFLAITRQRLKAKLQMERMQQEQQRMEQEIASAKEQLTMFTENIVEKTNLIEKLEEQVKGSSISSEQQLLITELSQQTILTEDDWIKFKSLFEKIYPSFFQKIKENSADITVAEQRMAALIKLQLTSKQMAAMLGISVDSVHKTRQRLRQRLQLNSETNLDEFIAGI